jgi:hypothetical protein
MLRTVAIMFVVSACHQKSEAVGKPGPLSGTGVRGAICQCVDPVDGRLHAKDSPAPPLVRNPPCVAVACAAGLRCTFPGGAGGDARCMTEDEAAAATLAP